MSESTSEVSYQQDGQCAIITLHRPAKRNSLTLAVCAAVKDYLHQATDDGVRAVILRGEGPAFCAGADLGEGTYSPQFHIQLYRMLASITDAPMPVIADIQGPAVVGGMQIAMAADLRVVGDGAWFKIPVAKLGISLDNWTIERCRELLGGARARTLLYTAHPMSVEELEPTGFISVRGDSSVATRLAADIAASAPLTLRHLKSVLNKEDPQPTAKQAELLQQCWASDDAKEAKLARKEKREPKFTGQ